MKNMFIVAHPDDEALGLGGFLYDGIRRGDEALVVIANADGIPSRPDLTDDLAASHDILGIRRRLCLGFDNLSLDKLTPFDVVPKIEEAMIKFGPDHIFTHWPGDINPDHRAVSAFAQQAARLFQRQESERRVRGLFFMEVPSSTEWGAGFMPDSYYEISEDGLRHKIEALACYRNVLRHDTHPRSERAIRALAVTRGSAVGLRYAEAVKTAWRLCTAATPRSGSGGSTALESAGFARAGRACAIASAKRTEPEKSKGFPGETRHPPKARGRGDKRSGATAFGEARP